MTFGDQLVSVLHPDFAMIGGLTPCLEVARMAQAFGVSVSPHFLPGLFVHLAAASEAVHWLEDFPLLEEIVQGTPEMSREGTLMAGCGPGHGLAVDGEYRKGLRA